MYNKYLEKIAEKQPSTYDQYSKPMANSAAIGTAAGFATGSIAGHGLGKAIAKQLPKNVERVHKMEVDIHNALSPKSPLPEHLTEESRLKTLNISRAAAEHKPKLLRKGLGNVFGAIGAVAGLAKGYSQAHEKSAEDKDLRPAVYGAAGAGLVYHSPSHLLGYTKVYHGTDAETAKKIHEQGMDPAKGGSGAANLRPDYVENSKGKVHVSRMKTYAEMYANIGKHSKGKGQVVTARIPRKHWDEMDHDKDGGVNKRMAATTTKKIDSEFIAKKPLGGIKAHMTRDNILNHIKSNPKSFATGVGRLGAGIGLMAAGVNQAIKNHDK